MATTRLPVSQLYVTELVPPRAIVQTLVTDLQSMHSRVRSLRSASLGDLWRIARDLVVALDRWADRLGDVSGEERMRIAVEVGWRFIEMKGGIDALRDLVAEAIDRVLPGFIARHVARLLVREKTAKALIRFVLELAVRELRDVAA